MPTVMALLLIVRVFDRSGAGAEDRLAALDAAGRILQQAGVAARWVDCSTAALNPAACTHPLGRDEVLLRITPAPAGAATGEQRTLGYSLVEPHAGGGTLATVFSDRVGWLADAARAPAPLVLGRAVAHELGHLLIGTTGHSASGLMRAMWTAADLARDRPSDWVFSAPDRARLRRLPLSERAPARLAEAGANGLPGDS